VYAPCAGGKETGEKEKNDAGQGAGLVSRRQSFHRLSLGIVCKGTSEEGGPGEYTGSARALFLRLLLSRSEAGEGRKEEKNTS